MCCDSRANPRCPAPNPLLPDRALPSCAPHTPAGQLGGERCNLPLVGLTDDGLGIHEPGRETISRSTASVRLLNAGGVRHALSSDRPSFRLDGERIAALCSSHGLRHRRYRRRVRLACRRAPCHMTAISDQERLTGQWVPLSSQAMPRSALFSEYATTYSAGARCGGGRTTSRLRSGGQSSLIER